MANENGGVLVAEPEPRVQDHGVDEDAWDAQLVETLSDLLYGKGPGDNHLVPRLLERARAGKLRRVGDGTNRVDHVYIDNAADAHLLAADRLEPGGPSPAGKAYFITNGAPVPLWDLVRSDLAFAGAF